MRQFKKSWYVVISFKISIFALVNTTRMNIEHTYDCCD